MGKKVLVLGASGKGNTGDELLAWTSVQLLTSINPEMSGTILTFNRSISEEFFSYNHFNFSNYYLHFPSIRYPMGYLFFKSIRKYKNYSMAVFPGGGFIYDYSIKILLSWYRKFLAIKRIQLPIILLGVGIGPLRTGISRLLAKKIIKLSDFIIVRDKKSFDLAMQLNIDESKLRLGADLNVLCNKFIDFSVKKKQKSRQCLIIPRYWPYKHTEENDKVLIKALSKIVQLAAYYFRFDSVNFLPMHRYDDLSLCQKVCSAINISGGIYKIRSINDIMSPIFSVYMVIAMRYHGALLSLLAGKHTLAISYDDKVANLMEDFDRSNNSIHWQDFINFNKDAIMQSFDYLQKDNLKSIPQIFKQIQMRMINAINEISDYFC